MMIVIHTLVTLFLLTCNVGAQNASSSLSFFNEVDLNVIPPSADTYSHMFQANFTVSVFGVPLATGGGQKDLAQFGKFFLKRFNVFQLQTQQATAKSSSSSSSSSSGRATPDLMMYDTEVTGQYVDAVPGTAAGQTIGYNVLSIKGYFVCVKRGCPIDRNAIPEDDTSSSSSSNAIDAAGRRNLQKGNGGTGTTRSTPSTTGSQVADDVRAKLVTSGQTYFKDVKCVRISTATTTYVDQSTGCDGYPVVKFNA